MYLSDVRKAIEVCLWADVVPDIQGHRGIGKTASTKQIASEWVDPFTKTEGLPLIALYCATQEVTDLIGFPTKVWASDHIPVIAGIAPKTPGDSIMTSWAPPEWLVGLRKYCDPYEESDRKIYNKMKKDGASEQELWLFWNRPKCIVFLDESRRAQRDVMQAMYPLILDKTLHTNKLPRGSRIITADNFAGAYDVRDPDEAYMSRFCHLELDAHIGPWHEWAMKTGVFSKVTNFLSSNPEFLISIPKDHEKAAIKYKPLPDPRRWDAVSRVESFGRKALEKTGMETSNKILKQVITGIVGLAAAEKYWSFSDHTISFEDVMTGKASVAAALETLSSDIEREKLREKLQIETCTGMQDRPYSKVEGERLCKCLCEMDSKERATAIMQQIFLYKNDAKLDQQWIDCLLKDPKIVQMLEHLLHRDNITDRNSR